MREYIQQAEKFLKDTNTMLGIEYKEYGSMNWDEDGQKRDIYICTLENKNGKYSFDFGQSINGTKMGEQPTIYDILSYLHISYCEDFNDFCYMYGYDNDSIKAFNTYKAVEEEEKELQKLFNEEQIEMLNEIC